MKNIVGRWVRKSHQKCQVDLSFLQGASVVQTSLAITKISKNWIALWKFAFIDFIFMIYFSKSFINPLERFISSMSDQGKLAVFRQNWCYCNKQGRKSAKHTKHTFSVYMKCIILQEISSTKTRSRILSKAFFHLPLISSTGSILKYPLIYFSILSRLANTTILLCTG